MGIRSNLGSGYRDYQSIGDYADNVLDREMEVKKFYGTNPKFAAWCDRQDVKKKEKPLLILFYLCMPFYMPET